jgi:hypothetical protein
MSVKHQYIVSFFNTSFDSLKDAKWNVKVAFTRQEAKKYLIHESIAHFIGENMHSLTPIRVDEHGNISFGRTIRQR